MSLLAEGYDGSNNEEVARKLYNDLPGGDFKCFTYKKNVVNKAFKEITSVTGKDDYLTLENVIADPTTGNRLSPLLTMKVIFETCEIKCPTVNGTTLSNIQNAMAIPTSDIVVLPDCTKEGHGAIYSAMHSQMHFGFDAVTEILKNCCASHTVIHSILKGALLTLYEKVKEWGSQQLETPGQEMALCTVLELMGKICEIVKEAKESTTRKTSKSNSSCGRCKTKGHESSPIIIPFINRVNARYADSISSAQLCQHYNPPPEFLVKGERKPRNVLPECSFTSSSNISSMTENRATSRVKEKVNKATLDKLIINQVNQKTKKQIPVPEKNAPLEKIESSKPLSPLFPLPESPQDDGCTDPVDGALAPIVEQEGREQVQEEITPQVIDVSPMDEQLKEEREQVQETPRIIDVGPMDGALAPTEEQVQKYTSEVESRGQSPGSEWMRLRDSANNKSIANYASKGSAINTGKYRQFNPTL